MNNLAILTVRNEGAFLLEWLAHHRAVGFSDFLVFSNNCTDGTDTMLDRLAALGWLTHARNDGPYDQGGIQFTALKQAAKLQQVKAADWILPIDIDEFVNIHVGDGTLAALQAALPEATAITLTWRLFGNNGQVRYTDQPVTETFDRSAPEVIYWPWRAAMFKTLYKNDGIYRKPGVHRPRSPDPNKLDEVRWFDGHGRPLLGDHFKTRRLYSDYGRPNYGLAQINHYPLGAMESYVLKADRGRAVHSDHILGLDYWVERNFNIDLDDSIRRYDTTRDGYLTELRADTELSDLHETAVAWRKTRFDALLQEDTYRGLFGRLLMAPPSRPVPAKVSKFMMNHAKKAHKVAH